MLTAVYADETRPAAEVCEALVDIDEGIQEWRYRHVKMVERIIGAQDRDGRLGRRRTTCARPCSVRRSPSCGRSVAVTEPQARSLATRSAPGQRTSVAQPSFSNSQITRADSSI